MAARLICAAGAALATVSAALADPVAPTAAATAATRLSDDVEVAGILRQLRDGAPTGLIQIDDVRIVDPRTGGVTRHSSIIVRGSRIRWVGETSAAPKVPDVTHIDGHDRFAVPGLTDMHIHSGRADGWLLNLAVGVTTVRDMDGFPWILRARDRINSGRMAGPTAYVAGTIIASEPFGGYAVVAAGPQNARAIVRTQAACGYDFIKVHNQLPQPMFDAVADQANTLGMALVGHVPHDISVDHALHVGKMRTTEHLKGFLNDRTLLPSDEDYAVALAGTQTWITPTLYTRRGYDRGPWARGVLGSAAARYVPPDVRAGWAERLARPNADDVKMGARFVETQATVMRRLLPLRPHWLTGTDAAGYSFNVMGFALLDELALLQQVGLTPAEAYRASTIEAADALGESDEFGAIRRGMRADIVLLDTNPLADGNAFRTNRGVMAHGLWLDRPALDTALARLAALYRVEPPAARPQSVAAQGLVDRLEKAAADGFVFHDGVLARFGDELGEAGLPALAARVRLLETAPTLGVCAVPTPAD